MTDTMAECPNSNTDAACNVSSSSTNKSSDVSTPGTLFQTAAFWVLCTGTIAKTPNINYQKFYESPLTRDLEGLNWYAQKIEIRLGVPADPTNAPSAVSIISRMQTVLSRFSCRRISMSQDVAIDTDLTHIARRINARMAGMTTMRIVDSLESVLYGLAIWMGTLYRFPSCVTIPISGEAGFGNWASNLTNLLETLTSMAGPPPTSRPPPTGLPSERPTSDHPAPTHMVTTSSLSSAATEESDTDSEESDTGSEESDTDDDGKFATGEYAETKKARAFAEIAHFNMVFGSYEAIPIIDEENAMEYASHIGKIGKPPNKYPKCSDANYLLSLLNSSPQRHEVQPFPTLTDTNRKGRPLIGKDLHLKLQDLAKGCAQRGFRLPEYEIYTKKMIIKFEDRLNEYPTVSMPDDDLVVIGTKV